MAHQSWLCCPKHCCKLFCSGFTSKPIDHVLWITYSIYIVINSASDFKQLHLFKNFIQENKRFYLKEFHNWQKRLTVEVKNNCLRAHYFTKNKDLNFRKFSEVMLYFNINLQQKALFQNSSAYNQNHLLYNKVTSVLKRKRSVLKPVRYPSTM